MPRPSCNIFTVTKITYATLCGWCWYQGSWMFEFVRCWSNSIASCTNYDSSFSKLDNNDKPRWGNATSEPDKFDGLLNSCCIRVKALFDWSISIIKSVLASKSDQASDETEPIFDEPDRRAARNLLGPDLPISGRRYCRNRRKGERQSCCRGARSSDININWRTLDRCPVWPDLAKFRHFGKILQVFGKLLTVYFLFGKMLILFGRIGYIIGLIFIVANSQILKKILTIWSHWLLHFWDWFQQR